MTPRHTTRALLLTGAAAILAACGGGGSDGGSVGGPVIVGPNPDTGGGVPVPTFVANEYPNSSTLKGVCETVRTGTDPQGNSYGDVQGERIHELFWLRSWMDETYLYYDQVTDSDPNNFTDVEAYFAERLTTAQTVNNTPVDRFSFTQTTEDFEASSGGEPTFGYGAEFAALVSRPTATLDRDWRVSFVQPGSEADVRGFTRGARIIEIDGADFLSGNSQAEVDTIVDGLFPATVGETHDFLIERPDGTRETLTLTSQSIAIEPVNDVAILASESGRRAGYIHYHTFFDRTGEAQLVDAFQELSDEGVDDLVLDLRYNGGGFLILAAQIGYMVAGPNSADQVFYSQTFNDKSGNRNPVTGEIVGPLDFVDETVGLSDSLSAGLDLPTLSLPRVFVLTTERSCSASEAVINGLIGIGVEVVQIGTTTCGKSTGQFPTENCGITFSPLHFRGENAQGFGDFDDGFTPGRMTGAAGPVIPGCEIADDFANPLGDPNEAKLAAALTYIDTGACPATAVAAASKVASDAFAQSPAFAPFAVEDLLLEHPSVARRVQLEREGRMDFEGTPLDPSK